MKKGMILFSLGAIGYCALEILSRGYTHYSMGVTGGVCLIAIEAIYTRIKGMALAFKAALASVAVTVAELIAGLIVNVWLGLNVWSYATEPYNFMGQICLKYSFIWFVLCLFLMSAMRAVKTELAKRKTAG